MGVALALVVALLAGCGVALQSIDGPVESYTETRKVWTRHVETYEDMESRLFVYATLKTEPFRRAWVLEYARIFALPDSQREQLLATELAELEEAWVVMIATATHEPSWNRLDPRDGIWDLRLEDDAGRFVRPTLVDRKRSSNPTWRQLYPYMGDQYTLWEVRFPRVLPTGEPLAASGQAVHLIVAGAPAQVKMSWKLP